jgi:hypothetical protein
MNIPIVTVIHNDTQEECVQTESVDTGKKLIHDMVRNKLNRELSTKEIENLENRNEVYIIDDDDNTFTFTIIKLKVNLPHAK